MTSLMFPRMKSYGKSTLKLQITVANAIQGLHLPSSLPWEQVVAGPQAAWTRHQGSRAGEGASCERLKWHRGEKTEDLGTESGITGVDDAYDLDLLHSICIKRNWDLA